MAASFGMCRLHMRGTGRLSKCFKKFDSLSQRRVGTTTVAAFTETANKAHQTDSKHERKSFYALQEARQEQAERSVLINCPPKTSEKKFLKYLSRHGDVSNCFFYYSYGTYAVVEFKSREGVASLREAAGLPSVQHEATVPFKSRLLALKSHSAVEHSGDQATLKCQPQATVPINELIQRLSREESIDQQLHCLTAEYQLTEENVRLRYLVCSLLKDIATAYFPECTIRPFGSTTNSFGKLGCDLDMFLDLDGISGRNIKRLGSGPSLEFQMKRGISERAVTQSILSVVGECVDQFGPGCVGVQKILNARCPLVRFAHQPSGFQCDLTANNRVAMKSSELLYLFGGLDARVRCLVFGVRCWARVHGLTSSIPGAWITNFSLTALVLFFLQRRSPAILPTLDHLKELAGPLDKCVIEGNDCTMASDYSRIKLQNNTETLETLLQEFFQFYGTFAFNKTSINIRKGMEQTKPESVALHIQNPFEPSLNVSKNVNATQLERFVALCRESAWLLQQGEVTKRSHANSAGPAPPPWGLAALLLPSVAEAAGIKGRRKKKREPASARIKSLLDSLKSNGGGGEGGGGRKIPSNSRPS